MAVEWCSKHGRAAAAESDECVLCLRAERERLQARITDLERENARLSKNRDSYQARLVAVLDDFGELAEALRFLAEHGLDRDVKDFARAALDAYEEKGR